MNRIKIALLPLFLIALTMFAGCEKDLGTEEEITSSTGTNNNSGIVGTGKKVSDVLAANDADHEAADDYTWNNSDIISVTFNGTSITGGGSGTNINGSLLTISAGGTYKLSGTLTNGQIVVNSADAKTVRILLDGANITSTTSAPIYIVKAAKTILVLADNTQNYITDASSYIFANAADTEPNAAVFSKDDLTIYGGGSLTVKGNYEDGITSKDGLIIKSGSLNVTSADDAIRGKNYLIVKQGNITVNAKGNGLISDNETDSTRGYVYLANGTFNIISGGDAITGATDALISEGIFTLITGGGSNYTANASMSSKGVKGIVNTIVEGGTFTISSSDDALHSNSNLVINGGSFTISSGDDGIHSDATLVINNGVINITKSYEGIESAAVTINDGNIHIVSSDDGLNGAGGNDGSSPGQFITTGNYHLYINGGYIYIYAAGDGIDINGSIEMTNGTVIVNGPTANNNGAIDYDSTFKLTGGFIVAAGSSGMAQAPGTNSSQYSVLLTFKTTFSANTLFHIESSDGADILTFVPKKNYQSIAFSSSKLTKGTTYNVYTGGSSTGTVTDGLYNDGKYSAGSKYTSFTISSIVTKVSG